MKNILFALALLVSFSSFGQTYYDLILIDSETQFKRVMIENNYKFDNGNDDRIGYLLNPLKNAQADLIGFDVYAVYQKKNTQNIYAGTLAFSFFSKDGLNIYQKIFAAVKERCSFFKITNWADTDLACYTCPDAPFGYVGLGLSAEDGSAIIKTFNN